MQEKAWQDRELREQILTPRAAWAGHENPAMLIFKHLMSRNVSVSLLLSTNTLNGKAQEEDMDEQSNITGKTALQRAFPLSHPQPPNPDTPKPCAVPAHWAQPSATEGRSSTDQANTLNLRCRGVQPWVGRSSTMQTSPLGLLWGGWCWWAWVGPESAFLTGAQAMLAGRSSDLTLRPKV